MGLDTDTVPDTVLEMGDTVPDTVPDTDSATLDTVPDTVSDTAMVDTVERDPLMPGTDAVMWLWWIQPWIRLWWIRTWIRILDSYPTNSPKKPFYTKLCHCNCRSE